MAKSGSYLRPLILLSWPAVLEQFFGTVVQYVDTAMVGRLGADATASVSLSSTYTWLINSVMGALGVGFLSYIARSIGEKNEERVRQAAGQAVLAVLAAGLLLTVATLAIAPYMPVWMGAEEGIRRDAALYFTCINAPLLFRAATLIFGAVIRAAGDTKTPMYIGVFVNLMNTGLNYLFIYRLGFGAVGAGYASAAAFTAGGILMTAAFVKNPVLKFRVSCVRPQKQVLGSCLKIGIPVMLTNIVSCSGYIVATSFVSSMATAVYAAHSIAITAETIFYIPGYGMQASTATLIGNALGERDVKKERGTAKAALFLIFSLMCVSGLLLFAGAKFMMSLFTNDREVIKIGSRLLRIVAFTEPVFGSSAVMEGIYNGLGRTKYPLAAELISRWGVRILGSFLCVRVWGMGIEAVWYCMIGDNIVKALLLAGRLGILDARRRYEKSNKETGSCEQ